MTERTRTVERMQTVKGKCPMGCGETLFLGDAGYVTCSWHECPDPSAASDALEAEWPRCAKKWCRRKVTQAFDVRSAWERQDTILGVTRPVRHYEVCDKHAAEFFRWPWRSESGDWVDVQRSERMKAELVAS